MQESKTTIPMPPPCSCCGAEPLTDHAENCNQLAAMRAQAYPTSLDRNGREWYLNKIDELQNDVKRLHGDKMRLLEKYEFGRIPPDVR